MHMSTFYSKEDMLQRLRSGVDEAGGIRPFAEKIGVSTQFLREVLHGHREISDKVAGGVGYSRRVMYVQVLPEVHSCCGCSCDCCKNGHCEAGFHEEECIERLLQRVADRKGAEGV